MEFKWEYLIMQIFWNFAFTNLGNVQNQIIRKVQITRCETRRNVFYFISNDLMVLQEMKL